MDDMRKSSTTRRRLIAGGAAFGLTSLAGISIHNANVSSQTNIAWLSPFDESTISGTVTLQVIPPVGTTRVLFYLDNKWIGSTRSAPWQLDLDTRELPTGRVTLRATARDDDGGGLLARQSIAVSITRESSDVPDEDESEDVDNPDEQPDEDESEDVDNPDEQPDEDENEDVDNPDEEPDEDTPPPGATYEITTGMILNDYYETDQYTSHWFYERLDEGDWQPTYTGPEWNENASGLLMNFRSVHAWFEDQTGNIYSFMPDFDPDHNVDAFIAALDDYRRHGVFGLAINLQGGNLGYPGAGWDNSAFNDDGTLRSDYMARVDKVLGALNNRRMTCILGLFYRPDRSGAPDSATDDNYRRAVDNATDWIAASGWRNVIIEIANEHNHSGGFGGTIVESPDGISELMNRSRDKLRNEYGIWTIPVSTSRTGGLEWPDRIGENADLAIPHANNVSDPSDYANRIRNIHSNFDYPIVCNEDDLSGGTTFTAATLKDEQEALDAFFDNEASWGLMHKAWNQYAASAGRGNADTPIRHALGASANLDVNDQIELEDNYAKAVFLHYAARTTANGDPLP